MRLRSLASSISLLLALLSYSTLGQAEESLDDFPLEKARIAAEPQLAQIEQEIAALGNHDWAGDYYYGDLTGVNVSVLLAPKSGYIFKAGGCTGLYGFDRGSVEYANGKLKFASLIPELEKQSAKYAKERLCIPWGERSYLIASDDVVDFCNSVNAGREPRSEITGKFLLRIGDAKRKVSGKPTIPLEYRAYLLDQPIETKIIEIGVPIKVTPVGGIHYKLQSVRVDAGKKSGLLSGMELHVRTPDTVYKSLVLKNVDENTAEGDMILDKDEKNWPSKGWVLSTSDR